jgi:hypothetical protein
MLEQLRASRRGVTVRLLRALGRAKTDISVSSAREPCAGCGEETAVGSVFFSDRHALTRSDGARAFLCSDCIAKVRASRRGEAPTDHDLRTVADNGLMVGIHLLGGF